MIDAVDCAAARRTYFARLRCVAGLQSVLVRECHRFIHKMQKTSHECAAQEKPVECMEA